MIGFDVVPGGWVSDAIMQHSLVDGRMYVGNIARLKLAGLHMYVNIDDDEIKPDVVVLSQVIIIVMMSRCCHI